MTEFIEYKIAEGRFLVSEGIRDDFGLYSVAGASEGLANVITEMDKSIRDNAGKLIGDLNLETVMSYFSLGSVSAPSETVDTYESLQTVILEKAWLVGNKRLVTRILNSRSPRLPLAIKPNITSDNPDLLGR